MRVEEDAGRGDRELRRRGERQQRDIGRALEPRGGCVRRASNSASSRRAGAMRALRCRQGRLPASMCVRQRKSPGAQTRCSHGRQGRPVDLHRFGRKARIAPGRRPRRQRRSVDPDDRRRRGRRDVQRAGVPADEERGSARSARAAPPDRTRRNRRRDRPRRPERRVARRRRCGRAASRSDGPELSTIRRRGRAGRERRDERRERRFGPSPERVAGADVHDDQLVLGRRRRRPAADPRSARRPPRRAPSRRRRVPGPVGLRATPRSPRAGPID